MKRRGLTVEPIIATLSEHGRAGARHEISAAMLYNRKAKCGGLELSQTGFGTRQEK
jgi:hypothetical protein